MDRDAIKRSFSRAAQTYSRSSHVQREVGRILVSHVHGLNGGGSVGRALELGCGDGGTTALLVEALCPSLMVLLDLSYEMLKVARGQFMPQDGPPTDATLSFVNAAMEDIGRLFRPASFDLVVSNSVLHWVRDTEETLLGIRRILRPGGTFACSVFTKNTLSELSEILEATIGTKAIASGFAPPDQVEGALARHFEPVLLTRLSIIRQYRDSWSLLKCLKDAGVTPCSTGHPVRTLFRRDLVQMDQLFHRHYAGVVARYEVVLFIGKSAGPRP